MLQTGLLCCQFPQEYLILPFGIAPLLPQLLEEYSQPLPNLSSRMTVNESSLLCLCWGWGLPKYISFPKCFFLEGLICGNADCYLNLVKNVAFTKHKNNLLKVWKGRGAVVWGRSLLPTSALCSVRCVLTGSLEQITI